MTVTVPDSIMPYKLRLILRELAASGGTPTDGQLGSGTASSSTFLRGDRTWASPTASVAISTASVAFTDGDTARRVTITDAAVSGSSKIMLTIRRPDTANDSEDPGYIYNANVVSIGSGQFDVLVSALDIGGMDCTGRPPSETITLAYQVA